MRFPETQAAAPSPSPTAWRGGRTRKTRAGGRTQGCGAQHTLLGPESSASATILLPPRPAPNMKQLQGGGFSSTRDARPRRQALCEPGPGCQ